MILSTTNYQWEDMYLEDTDVYTPEQERRFTVIDTCNLEFIPSFSTPKKIVVTHPRDMPIPLKRRILQYRAKY